MNFDWPPITHIKWPGIIWTIVLVWTILQTQRFFQTVGVDTFSTALEALGYSARNSVPFNPDNATIGIMRLLSYTAAFWAAMVLASSRIAANALLNALLGSAVIVTMLGWVFETTSHSCLIFTFLKVSSATMERCTFSGTFVNPSNYADYASLAALACLARLHTQFSAASSIASAKIRWRARFRSMGGSIDIAVFMLLVAGIISSASKAALFSFVVAALFIPLTMGWRRHSRLGRVLGESLFIATIVILGTAMVGDFVVRRTVFFLENGGFDRAQLFQVAISMVTVRPWTGWGLNSFGSLYSIFQPSTLPSVYDKAHNVYLEGAVELGVPAVALLSLCILLIAIRCVSGIRHRRRDPHYSLSAVASVVFIGLHSTVDFGIQIPAVAIAFAVILGIGWAQSWNTVHNGTPEAKDL